VDTTRIRAAIAATHMTGTTTTWQLRESTTAATEPGGRLGRHIEHDLRSLGYAVDAGLRHVEVQPRTVEWKRWSPILDQGDLGSCTGNALTGWFGCAPYVGSAADAAQYDEDFAVRLYELATQLDHIPGEYPPDDTGSTGLAVAKAARRADLIHAYHHVLTTLGLHRALTLQPVIVGITWYSSFDTPNADGTIHLTSDAYVRGGHEVLVRGWDGANLIADNSWGESWGDNGSFRIPSDVWQELRSEGADVVVPVR